jgi:sec-independent protein translocase protein TatB
MFDLSIEKLLVIGVLALFLVGPDKLPLYAAQLGKWVRVARSMTDEAKQRVTSEMGSEFGDVDWAGLDPRRYHPRRLIADAWNSAAEPARPGDPGTPGAPEQHADADLLQLADTRAAATEPARTASHLDIGS